MSNHSLFTPLTGSQTLFCASKAFEVFFSGTRGNGKSECALYKVLAPIGTGYGSVYKVCVFRMQHNDLEDLIDKSKLMFPGYFPGAKYNSNQQTWTFPEGETIRFSNLAGDYRLGLGKGYVKLIFDELPEIPDEKTYKGILAATRPMSMTGMSEEIKERLKKDRQVISTGNPYGAGFSWVKRKFITDCGLNNSVEREEGSKECIHGTIWENYELLGALPDYVKTAFPDLPPAIYKAWVMGSWDNPQGGIFDEYWNPHYNVVKPFQIPQTWYVDRTFDWGSTRPFSLDYWAMSDGSPYRNAKGESVETIYGDIFKIHEYYGCKPGKRNVGLAMPARQIARIIKQTDQMIANKYGVKVSPGVCDIDPMRNIEMQDEQVYWKPITPKIKERVPGWELCQRKMRSAETRSEEGLFVFDTCKYFIEIIPTLPRCPKNPFDLDTDSEDHLADSMRYKIKDSQIRITSLGTVFGI